MISKKWFVKKLIRVYEKMEAEGKTEVQKLVDLSD